MGVYTASGETLLDATPEEVYDFVSNPRNWRKTLEADVDIDTPSRLPLEVGDVWTEVLEVGEASACHSTWRLITAVRPRTWAFQQVDAIGAAPDGSGGVDGITTISYTFTPVGTGTLFHRSLRCEVPHGTVIAEPLLLASAQPAHIEQYQRDVEREIHRARADQRA